MDNRTLVGLGAVGGALLGLFLSNQSNAGIAPVLFCGAVGAAIGLGAAFVFRLGRIGNKALKKLEKKLDE